MTSGQEGGNLRELPLRAHDTEGPARTPWELRAGGDNLRSRAFPVVVEADPSRRVLEKFVRLRDNWLNERPPSSNPRDLTCHPAYLAIIGMGPPAVPFIISELREYPDHWFVALRAITECDPVSEGARGKVREMAKDWVEWYDQRWASRRPGSYSFGLV